MALGTIYNTHYLFISREHDFCNFTHHFKMGSQKFGNQDSNCGEIIGATSYTGKLLMQMHYCLFANVF